MNERTKKWLVGIIAAIVFVVSIVLVLVGHKNIGVPGLMTMFVGLVGLVILLWAYNRQYK